MRFLQIKLKLFFNFLNIYLPSLRLPLLKIGPNAETVFYFFSNKKSFFEFFKKN